MVLLFVIGTSTTIIALMKAASLIFSDSVSSRRLYLNKMVVDRIHDDVKAETLGYHS